MRLLHLLWCVLLALPVHAGSAPSTPARSGPLTRLHWLIGQWQGEGTDAAGVSRQLREVVCALECRHLSIETRAQPSSASAAMDLLPVGAMGSGVRSEEAQGAAGAPAAMGMWSVDPLGERLLLHTFDSKASVTTYVEDPAAGDGGVRQLVLTAEWLADAPRGSRARFVYTFTPPDRFHERFEVASGRKAAFALVAEHVFVRAPVAVDSALTPLQSGPD